MSDLQVRNVSIRFGGIVALDSVSFSVAPRQIMGLGGPNGSGKSTIINCISRFYARNAGSITFDGVDLMKKRPHELIGLGISRTFQQLELYPTLTVLENVLVGQHHTGAANVLSAALRLPQVRSEERRMRERAHDALGFAGLSGFEGHIAGTLALGVRKRVDLARALVARPKLLLLDEPAAGLSHDEMDELGGLIRRTRDELGAAVVIADHRMSFVAAIADRLCVLAFGKKIADGAALEVEKNPAVIEAYFGEGLPADRMAEQAAATQGAGHA